MSLRPTPETDCIVRNVANNLAATLTVKCGKLERERDEARAEVAMLREERNILARAKAAVTEGVEQQNLPAGVSRKGCHERPEPSPHFIDTPKTYESDTPETCEAVERWQQGKINIFTKWRGWSASATRRGRRLPLQLASA